MNPTNPIEAERSTNRARRRPRALLAVVALLAAVAAGACGPEHAIQTHFGPLAGQARAIAHCESRMDPRAVSRTNDHGLFQINAVHRHQFTQVTGRPWSEVYNPYWNARYAKWLYDQQGWRPWTCRTVL